MEAERSSVVDLELVLLGMALANTRVAASVAKEFPVWAFQRESAALFTGIVAAIRSGKTLAEEQPGRDWFARHGIKLSQGKSTVEAVARRVLEAGRKRRQIVVMQELADAAKLLSPEQLRELTMTKLAEINARPGGTNEPQGGAESIQATGRSGDQGNGRAQPGVAGTGASSAAAGHPVGEQSVRRER